MKKIFLLLLASFFLSGCEKDDICDETTPTTPKVVIEFFDTVATTTAKNVTNLKVTAAGFTSELKVTHAVESLFKFDSTRIMFPILTSA